MGLQDEFNNAVRDVTFQNFEDSMVLPLFSKFTNIPHYDILPTLPRLQFDI